MKEKNKKTTSELMRKAINKGVAILLVLASVYLLLMIVPFFFPLINNFFFGEKILDTHIATVLGNETNTTLKAEKLMTWLQDNTRDAYMKKTYLRGLLWGIYNISNKPTLFIKTDKASWVITSKLGNCGEKAWYFVEVMNRSGTRSRIVQVVGEDHALAEFYTDGRWVFVDPSGNIIINDTVGYASGRYWSRLEAEDLSGNKEDVTELFIPNLTELNISVEGNKLLSKRTAIVINSVLLKERTTDYKSPIEVSSYVFNKNQTHSIKVGPKKEYQMVKVVDLFLFYFKETSDLDLTYSKEIIINPKEVIKLKNIHLRIWCLIMVLLAGVLILVAFYRKNKHMSRTT